LETLRQQQKELLSLNMTDFLQATQKITNLENAQQTLHHSFEEMRRVLNTLMAQFILDPIDINRLYTLQNELHIELQQLIMYERELKMATQPNFVDIEQYISHIFLFLSFFLSTFYYTRSLTNIITYSIICYMFN
jgi:hypothetical protein